MTENPWGLSLTPPPLEVAELAAVAVDAVRNACGMTLDLTSDTLPFLDHLVRENRKLPTGVRPLLHGATGACLGETCRRTFGGIWHLPDPDPLHWSVRFFSCPLAIFPVVMGVEIFRKKLPESSPPTVVVSPSMVDVLENALAQATPVTLEEYYSFCGRFDAIHLMVDFLTELEHLQAREQKLAPRVFGVTDPADLS